MRAGELYAAYCAAVGGVAHDGKPLPDWATFSTDPGKAKQAAGWEAVAAASQSDGYHTFDELYEHRHALFLALMAAYHALSWISTKHHDGSALDGWFIAGIKLPTGDVSYHLPSRLWSEACATGAAVLKTGMWWDGHTAEQVVDRLKGMAGLTCNVKEREGTLRAWLKDTGLKLVTKILPGLMIYWPASEMEESTEDIAEWCDNHCAKAGMHVYSFATAVRTPYEFYVWDGRDSIEFKARLHGPFETEEEARRMAVLIGGAS